MTYRCTGGFAVFVDGQPRVIAGGQLVGDEDPMRLANPGAFERVEEYTARREAAPQSAAAVETATAAPGEARALTKVATPHTTSREQKK